MSQKAHVDGYDFCLSEYEPGKWRIMVFKGQAVADVCYYASKFEADADFERVKKAKSVTWNPWPGVAKDLIPDLKREMEKVSGKVLT